MSLNAPAGRIVLIGGATTGILIVDPFTRNR